MDSCWLHFVMCTWVCLFVWVHDREIIMLFVQTWLRCFLSVCFMLIHTAKKREHCFSLSPPTQQLSTHSLSPSLLLLFHEIFTLRVEAASSLVFSQTQSDVCSCLSLSPQSCSHLYLEFGKQTNLVQLRKVHPYWFVVSFLFLVTHETLTWSLCLLCVLFCNCPWCWKVGVEKRVSVCLSVFMMKVENCVVSSQAPHVSRSVEDETKYIELMVINDHLMVRFNYLDMVWVCSYDCIL